MDELRFDLVADRPFKSRYLPAAAEVEDEDQYSLQTPDGGSAWIVVIREQPGSATPRGPWSLGYTFLVGALTPQIAAAILETAVAGRMSVSPAAADDAG